jgi:hypothetical protein
LNVPCGNTPNAQPLPSVACATVLIVPSPPHATTMPPLPRASATVARAISGSCFGFSTTLIRYARPASVSTRSIVARVIALSSCPEPAFMTM